jgi:hypothetical protein
MTWWPWWHGWWNLAWHVLAAWGGMLSYWLIRRAFRRVRSRLARR